MRKLFGNKDARLFDLISEPVKINFAWVESNQKLEGIALQGIAHVTHLMK